MRPETSGLNGDGNFWSALPLLGVGGMGNRTRVRVPQTRGFDAPGYLNVRAERVARAVGALSVERGPGVRETLSLGKERGRGEVVKNPAGGEWRGSRQGEGTG